MSSRDFLWEDYKKKDKRIKELESWILKVIRESRGHDGWKVPRSPRRKYPRNPDHKGRSIAVCEECRETKEIHGLGLCFNCYMKQYMRKYRKKRKPTPGGGPPEILVNKVNKYLNEKHERQRDI